MLTFEKQVYLRGRSSATTVPLQDPGYRKALPAVAVVGVQSEFPLVPRTDLLRAEPARVTALCSG